MNNSTNNKKLMNWILFSCFSLIMGVSLILNIIYIPKYIQANKRNTIDTTQITIDAVIGNPNTTPTLFFSSIEYNTNFDTLGNLIEHYPQRFEVKTFAGIGNFLNNVSQKGDGVFTGHPSDEYWFIYRFDTTDNKWILPDDGSAGMDLLPLKNDQHYRLALYPS